MHLYLFLYLHFHLYYNLSATFNCPHLFTVHWFWMHRNRVQYSIERGAVCLDKKLSSDWCTIVATNWPHVSCPDPWRGGNSKSWWWRWVAWYWYCHHWWYWYCIRTLHHGSSTAIPHTYNFEHTISITLATLWYHIQNFEHNTGTLLYKVKYNFW